MTKKFSFAIIANLFCASIAQASWLCEEAASIREQNIYTLCGIGENTDEDRARKSALKNALEELDLVCRNSADCRDQELNIEPLRNECQKVEKVYKCYRAVRAEILLQKRSKPIEIEKSGGELERKEALVTRYECSYNTEETLERFSDLTSAEKIESSVKAATRIPFRLACIGFHFSVMRQLVGAKINNKTYNAFLRSALQSDFHSSDMQAAAQALEFLHRQGPYDLSSWKVALGLFARSPKNLMYQFAPYLFHGDVNQESRAIELERLDETMKLAFQGGIGRPVASEPERVFRELARGLVDEPTANWLAHAFFKKYGEKVKLDDPREIMFTLLKHYKATADTATKNEAVTWIARAIKQATNVSIDDVTAFPRQIADEIRGIDSETESGARKISALKAHRETYLNLAATSIDQHFAKLTERHQIEPATNFCLEMNLPCPSLLPNADALGKMLQSQTLEKKRLALLILSKQPAKSRLREKEIFQLLNDEYRKDRGSGSHELITLAIQCLLNHRVADPKKIERILALSLDRVFSYDEVTEKLGELLTPAAIAVAENDSHQAQLTGVAILRKLAKRDPKAREALTKMAGRPGDGAISRAAREALEDPP